MPAEKDPAEPNALTQSLQLTCSLTPSSTEPSTRLVIIWLKRCLPRSPIDPALESAPVTGGGGGGATTTTTGPLSQPSSHSPADAGEGWNCVSTSQVAAMSAADAMKLRVDLFVNLFIVSARTACRWDRCRHRREASRLALHPQTVWCCKVLPPLRRSRRRSKAGC